MVEKSKNKLGIIVLAAGKGTRMTGVKPKVLRMVAKKPILVWTCELIKSLAPAHTVFVLGYKAEVIKKVVDSEKLTNIEFLIPDQMEGTGAHTRLGLSKLPKDVLTVLVLNGDDSALYRARTIKSFIKFHVENRNKATFLTSMYKKPLTVGGLKRDQKGEVVGVWTRDQLIEDKMPIIEVVCGAYCFDREWLEKNIKLLQKAKSGEYPLPGLIEIGAANREYTKTFPLPDYREWNSVNTLLELIQARRKKKYLLKHD